MLCSEVFVEILRLRLSKEYRVLPSDSILADVVKPSDTGALRDLVNVRAANGVASVYGIVIGHLVTAQLYSF